MNQDDEVARALGRLSTAEMVDALRTPRFARSLMSLLVGAPSRRLGRSLAAFDRRIAAAGTAVASTEALAAFGASVRVVGEPPRRGASLVVVNHPGAYDALAVMAALGRDDVALLAADRAFLRAMPRLAERLVFIADDGVQARASSVRRALERLADGCALVHFGAGAIEPDARFTSSSAGALGAWQDGTGLLAARAVAIGAGVVPTFVSGVHSARAKSLPFVRWAEKRGVTTVAPLVQAALPGFRDVDVEVRFGPALDGEALLAAGGAAERTAMVRSAVALLERAAEEARR